MNGGIADRYAWRLQIAVTGWRRGEVAVLGAARHLVRAGRFVATTVGAIATKAGAVRPPSAVATAQGRAWPSRCSASTWPTSTTRRRDAATRPLAEIVHERLRCMDHPWWSHREVAPAATSAMHYLVNPPRGRGDRRIRYLFPRPWAAILRIGQARGKVVEHFEVQDAVGNPASFLVLRHITRGESAAAGASFVARWAMRGALANPGGEVE